MIIVNSTLLVLHMFSNNVHDKWSCKVSCVLLKSAEFALLGEILKCLHSFRWSTVDVR